MCPCFSTNSQSTHSSSSSMHANNYPHNHTNHQRFNFDPVSLHHDSETSTSNLRQRRSDVPRLFVTRSDCNEESEHSLLNKVSIQTRSSSRLTRRSSLREGALMEPRIKPVLVRSNSMDRIKGRQLKVESNNQKLEKSSNSSMPKETPIIRKPLLNCVKGTISKDRKVERSSSDIQGRVPQQHIQL